MIRVCRRTTDVRHSQKKWYTFVKERQDVEDAVQEKEVVKIKKEAQLLKRYMKEMEVRMRRKKQREEKKKQDAFLDQAYEERMRQDGEPLGESSEEWDPIEDILKGEREDLVALMYKLLWLEMSQQSGEPEPYEHDAGEVAQNDSVPTPPQEHHEPSSADKENMDPNPASIGDNTVALSKAAKKRAKAKAKAKKAAEVPKDDSQENHESDGSPKIEVNETREELRDRLIRGIAAEEHGGRLLRDINDSGEGKPFDMPGIRESEVDQLLDEVAEIKELLLCRLLLSQSNLLPIAIRARNLTEFFADAQLNLADLRDLCLRYEQPKLQEIRDACADFARGDGEESDDEEENEDDEQTAHELALQDKYKKDAWRGRYQDEKYRTRQEQANEQKAGKKRQVPSEDYEKVIVDFGEIDQEGNFQNRKVRVRVCGKSIWNYPSEKAVGRGGWRHFSIIAKGSRFQDAVTLCREYRGRQKASPSSRRTLDQVEGFCAYRNRQCLGESVWMLLPIFIPLSQTLTSCRQLAGILGAQQPRHLQLLFIYYLGGPVVRTADAGAATPARKKNPRTDTRSQD